MIALLGLMLGGFGWATDWATPTVKMGGVELIAALGDDPKIFRKWLN